MTAEPGKPGPEDAANCDSTWRVSRRHFLKAAGGAAIGLSAAFPAAHAEDAGGKSVLRFGMVADPHYADTPPRGTRHYAESAAKLQDCVDRMNEEQVPFLVELGDFKDEGKPPVEADSLKFLETIEDVFVRFRGRRYHVLGNHDMDSISKPQFLARVENSGIDPDATYYSFDLNGVHFVVLDANYKADGTDYDHGNFVWTDTNIPVEEIAWLQADLASGSGPVIVFVHQQLDGDGDFTVNNAKDVRKVLEDSQRVAAVFQGHNHAGHYSYSGGIHYYTLKAVVEGSGAENNAYVIVDVMEDHSLVVTGYVREESRTMA